MMHDNTGQILTAGSAVLCARMLQWLQHEEAVVAVTLMLRGSHDGSIHHIRDFKAELTRDGHLSRVS